MLVSIFVPLTAYMSMTQISSPLCVVFLSSNSVTEMRHFVTSRAGAGPSEAVEVVTVGEVDGMGMVPADVANVGPELTMPF